jgi:hypothetical protein
MNLLEVSLQLRVHRLARTVERRSYRSPIAIFDVHVNLES